MNKTQLQFTSRKPSANRGSLGRRLFALVMSLLLVCSLPLAAFAEEYDLANGSITVTADGSGQYVTQEANNIKDVKQTTETVIKQTGSETSSTTNTVTIKAEENATANVTIQDVNIVISDPTDNPQNHSGEAAVTIDVEDGAAANVTLDGVNIDVGGTGGYDYYQDKYFSGEVAVQITGNGDVTMELDGENTVQGGYKHAAVEKNTTDDSGKGELTITDENEIHGSLKATGGEGGSGIGGGYESTGSNITITGSAEVTAKGGDSGSGIGGGVGGSGSDITISGSAEVTAKGGESASGIGGGDRGSGSNITVSEDAQVKAQGGESRVNPSVPSVIGAGAAIGNGGIFQYGATDAESVKGKEVAPNTDDLNEGWIAKYNPGTDMDTKSPNSLTYKGASNVTGGQPIVKLEPTCTEDGHEAGFSVDGALVAVTIPATGHSFTNYVSNNDGTKTARCDHPGCNETHTITDPGTRLPAPLYQLKGQDGMAVGGKTEQKDGVLTITVDADFASLTGYLGGLQGLRAQGVDTIVFVTNGATSTFALADLLASMTAGDSYALTHDGETVTFTLATGTDISGILK